MPSGVTYSEGWTCSEDCSNVIVVGSRGTVGKTLAASANPAHECVDILREEGTNASLEVKVPLDGKADPCAIAIVSTARNVEVHTEHGYLCTVRATPLEDAGDDSQSPGDGDAGDGAAESDGSGRSVPWLVARAHPSAGDLRANAPPKELRVKLLSLPKDSKALCHLRVLAVDLGDERTFVKRTGGPGGAGGGGGGGEILGLLSMLSGGGAGKLAGRAPGGGPPPAQLLAMKEALARRSHDPAPADPVVAAPRREGGYNAEVSPAAAPAPVSPPAAPGSGRAAPPTAPPTALPASAAGPFAGIAAAAMPFIENSLARMESRLAARIDARLGEMEARIMRRIEALGESIAADGETNQPPSDGGAPGHDDDQNDE